MARINADDRLNPDFDNLEMVDSILSVINPYYSRTGNDAESRTSYIKYVVENEFYKDSGFTYMGTGGWYVTVYPSNDGHYTHKGIATIMPYTVKKHLEEIETLAKKIINGDVREF